MMGYKFTITTTPEVNKDDGYLYCGACDTKLMLVGMDGYFVPDQEPYKPGEEMEKECPCQVFVGELTGHFCTKCEVLTSLSYNS